MRATKTDSGAGTASASDNGSQVVDVGPLVTLGGPASAAWQEDGLTRAHELSSLTTWILKQPRESANGAAEAVGPLVDNINAHLQAARETAGRADGRGWFGWTLSSFRGSQFERTLGNLDAVEAHLLRLAPDPYLRGEMPSVQAHVSRYLPKDDPRRARIDELAPQAPNGSSSPSSATPSWPPTTRRTPSGGATSSAFAAFGTCCWSPPGSSW
jgi:hypothetical protein